ncbi:MAG: hypothetical protein Q9227_001488 [Pyrenula ochraceoflavens]
MTLSPRPYFLTTDPFPSTSPSSQSQNSRNFNTLYLRLHGGGTNSVLLTPSPPVFLRAYFKEQPSRSDTTFTAEATGKERPESGKQVFTSIKDGHNGRTWSLKLTTDPRDYRAVAAWERVEIVETTNREAGSDDTSGADGEDGWAWEEIEIPIAAGETVKFEHLVWKGGEIRLVGAREGDEGVAYEWKGWLAAEGQYADGKPQLFWATQKLDEEKGGLPEGMERVLVRREDVDARQG